MAKIKTTHNIVLRILEDKPATRSDDWILILEVLKEYISTDMTVESIFLHHIELGIPSFETIRRCRQKIQSLHPHLAEDRAKAIRKQEEEEYRQYALNFKL